MRFSEVIIQKISDGDFSTKIGVIRYSTNPREIITVEMMEEHEQLRSVKRMNNLLYGKRTTQMVIDEYLYPVILEDAQ